MEPTWTQKLEEKALEQGRADGISWSILALLQKRGLPVTEEQRLVFSRCQDLAQLEVWLLRTMEISTVDELLSGISPTIKKEEPNTPEQHNQETAFKELEDTYARNKNWDQLIAILLDRVDQVSNSEGASLLLRVAQILEQEQKDPENAFHALLAATKRDYSNNKVTEELERLASATNKWSELLQHHTYILNSVTDDKTNSIAIANKIAKWYRKYFDQVDYSIAYYNYVLNLEPTDQEALNALVSIYTEKNEKINIFKYQKILDELKKT